MEIRQQTQNQLAGLNLNAVGSFGWIKNPLDTTRYIKKVRKYFYEDYWDHFFSIGEWVGNRHPDFVSHQGLVWDPPGPLYPYDLALYGSVREYWKEVSYGNMTIQPARTRMDGLPENKYNTGIINRVDTIGGRNLVRWIKLRDRWNYEGSASESADRLATGAFDTLRALHQRNPSDPDYVAFDVDSFVTAGGKVAVIGAGGYIGGGSRRDSIRDARKRSKQRRSGERFHVNSWQCA
jgi:hypothetical protein